MTAEERLALGIPRLSAEVAIADGGCADCPAVVKAFEPLFFRQHTKAMSTSLCRACFEKQLAAIAVRTRELVAARGPQAD